MRTVSTEIQVGPSQYSEMTDETFEATTTVRCELTDKECYEAVAKDFVDKNYSKSLYTIRNLNARYNLNIPEDKLKTIESLVRCNTKTILADFLYDIEVYVDADSLLDDSEDILVEYCHNNDKF